MISVYPDINHIFNIIKAVPKVLQFKTAKNEIYYIK